MSNRLEKLRDKAEKINAQIVLLKKAEDAKKKGNRTHRLVLLGLAAERLSRAHPSYESALLNDLNRSVVIPADRMLFGLPPRTAPPKNSQEQPATSENPQA